MTVEKTNIDTLIVGGGQAGIAMSEHLTKLGISHLVIEKNRIAEAWRSGRWDSLVANGPAWHDRFPGMELKGGIPIASFPKTMWRNTLKITSGPSICRCVPALKLKARFATADDRGLPLRPRRALLKPSVLLPRPGRFKNRLFHRLRQKRAAFIKSTPPDTTTRSSFLRAPCWSLAPGSSGVQIADELQRAGRRVYLSVGAHDRRRAHIATGTSAGGWGCWACGMPPPARPGKEHVTIAVSGAHGGHTVDFRELAHRGITLVGLTKAFESGMATFQPDLCDNIRRGDENYLALLDGRRCLHRGQWPGSTGRTCRPRVFT